MTVDAGEQAADMRRGEPHDVPVASVGDVEPTQVVEGDADGVQHTIGERGVVALVGAGREIEHGDDAGDVVGDVKNSGANGESARRAQSAAEGDEVTDEDTGAGELLDGVVVVTRSINIARCVDGDAEGSVHVRTGHREGRDGEAAAVQSLNGAAGVVGRIQIA